MCLAIAFVVVDVYPDVPDVLSNWNGALSAHVCMQIIPMDVDVIYENQISTFGTECDINAAPWPRSLKA